HGGKLFPPQEQNHEHHAECGYRLVAGLFCGRGQRRHEGAGGGLFPARPRLRARCSQRCDAAGNSARRRAVTTGSGTGKARPGEHPLWITATQVAVRCGGVLHARAVVIRLQEWDIAWMMARDAPWDAAFYWSIGAFLWFHYFARLSRRTGSLVFAIFLTLFPLRYALHYFFPSAPGLTNNIGEVAVLWITAAILWFQYFRLRRR